MRKDTITIKIFLEFIFLKFIKHNAFNAETSYITATYINDFKTFADELIQQMLLISTTAEIKAIADAVPQLADYKIKNQQTLLDIVFYQRKSDPDLIRHLIEKEFIVSNSHTLYQTQRPNDPLWNKCVSYYLNAPLFNSEFFIKKLFPKSWHIILQYYIYDIAASESDHKLIKVETRLARGTALNKAINEKKWDLANDLIERGAEIQVMNRDKEFPYHHNFFISSEIFLPDYPMTANEVKFSTSVIRHSPESFITKFMQQLSYISHNRLYNKPDNYYYYKFTVEKIFSIMVDYQENIYDTLFAFAVQFNYINLIDKILSKRNFDLASNIKKKNLNNQTPFQVAIDNAVTHGSLDLVRRVLDMKADINMIAETEYYPQTPKSKLLITEIASLNNFTSLINLKMTPGQTALHAVLNLYYHHNQHAKYFEFIDFLLENKADATIKNNRQLSPLYIAATQATVSPAHRGVYNLFLKHDRGPLFYHFLKNYQPSLGSFFFGNSMKKCLFATGGEKVHSMKGVLKFLQQQEKNGKKETDSHKAMEALRMDIIKNGL